MRPRQPPISDTANVSGASAPLVEPRRLRVEADAARADHAATEAAAAQERGHVEELSAKAPAERHRRQESDVARQRAEIAHVVGEPLELERDPAQRLRARG